jgi:CheY-like chemotaxis protein
MSQRRPKVLIVDDEDNIVLALHRVLYQDNDRYDVLLARSAEIAQQILEDGKVDVLVTDVHLPEKSGMDLLSWVAVQAPATRVIVMTAFDVSGIKDRAHAFGCLQLMRKPFDVHAMRTAIVRALALRDSFAGSLADLSCVDVLQMLCIARKTTALRISAGASAGVVHIDAGDPVHAVWDDLVGEEAFFRILGVKSGIFHTTPLPPDIERSLRGDWQHLMIEGLRRLDETAAGRERSQALAGQDRSQAQEENVRRAGERDSFRIAPGSVPPPRVVVPSPSPRHAPELATLADEDLDHDLDGKGSRRAEVARLLDEGFGALRAGRREDARRAWEEALRIDPQNRMLELNLRKLGGAPPRPAANGAREAG